MNHSDIKQRLQTEFLPFVQKPMQYAGGEINSVRKDLTTVSLHGVLCFPETYEIGMSHYGGQILYHIVNKRPEWALSRCYHPWTDAESLMRAKAIPLFSLEYLEPVRNADWIGFSVNYELQYTNLVNMLDLAGIPVCSKDRTAGFPFVIAGGSVMGNPEPLADFVDAIVIGDGEEAIVSVCAALQEAKRCGAAKPDILATLSSISGLFVPALRPATAVGAFVASGSAAAPVVAAKIDVLSDESYPVRPIVPLVNVVHHRLVVEVLRGCTRGCRFCSAGFYYRPVRERSPQSILGQAQAGIAATGFRDIGLLSLSTADYSALTPLLRDAAGFAAREHVSLSLPSTRIDALDKDDLDAMQAIAPFSSFTLAPEAGSQRLRNVINKGFSDEQILATVSTLLSRGVQTIKLYFMIGLPTETDEDIMGIVTLAENIAELAWRKSHRVAVNVALSPFSPKPHTPFQWDAMDSMESLLAKSKRIKSALSSKRNIKTSYRDPAMAFLESVLARGDRKLGACILAAWKSGGHFDGWDEHFDLGRWKAAAKTCGIRLETYAEAIPFSQPLPWSEISTGVSQTFLRLEREKAAAGEITTDCRDGNCTGCGVCKDAACRAAQRVFAPSSNSDITSVKQPPRQAEERRTYRLIYKKDSSTRFLGHLDMMNVLLRALRTARVPLAFSAGCRPHPLVSFGPPLSLGIAARAELLDVTVNGVLGEAVAEINRCLPLGLAVLDAKELPAGGASLNEDIRAGHYLFEPCSDAVSSDVFADVIASFLAMQKVEIDVTKNGATRKKDIRPLVHTLAMCEDPANSFEAVLSMESGNTCKAFELLAALFPGKSCWDFLVTRLECLKLRVEKRARCGSKRRNRRSRFKTVRCAPTTLMACKNYS